MKRIYIFSLSLFLILNEGCATSDNLAENISEAEQAIDFCYKEFKKFTSDKLDADRVYVVSWHEYVELLFTVGEVGSFGPRSPDYRGGLYCGVKNQGTISLYELSFPMRKSFVSTAGYMSISAEVKKGTIEMLFLREGDGFKFISNQDYDPGKNIIKSTKAEDLMIVN